MRISTLDHLEQARAAGMKSLFPSGPKMVVSTSSCGLVVGARDIWQAVSEEAGNVAIGRTGCFGYCQREPVVAVLEPARSKTLYGEMTPHKAAELLRALATGASRPDSALCRIDKEENILDRTIRSYIAEAEPAPQNGVPLYREIPFFGRQLRIVLRNCGVIDPRNIDEYIARGGYFTLWRVLHERSGDEVIDEITASGLRGRGGAGFPTGRKWRLCREAEGDPKYLVCNADEGDPGAYMDRIVLEGDPHSVLEGMIIGAYAIGCQRGYIYVRAEYPLAMEIAETALESARERGLLGEDIMGSGFSFDIELVPGAGAFVCGEETALLASIEGRVGEPRQRPPYPAERGLWDKPTNINNVKTWANVPVILARGPEWFAGIGTEQSKGTMVFSLVGKVKNTGLVEVPMGITLRDLVYDLGGGIAQDRRFKAVQTGGPSGGCVPSDLMDLPVDYERLTEAGAMMGSGGMVVMDENTCMVDMAKYFLTFTTEESCGKCTACREGTKQMLAILTKITAGEGSDEDLELLEELATTVKAASLCGLGQTAPNPVLTTLRYFRDEYEAHVSYKQCPASVCRDIVFAACKYSCPLDTDVPAFVASIAHGKYQEAFDIIGRVNPFPIVSGYVCHHPCEDRCQAGETDDPVAVKALKRFAGDQALAGRYKGRRRPRISKTDAVAIVGSGPAGLAAAHDLIHLGYPVTVFESSDVIGGMLGTVIPEFRLPGNILEHEIKAIIDTGVVVRTGVTVGRDPSIEDLMNDGHMAVLLATGAHTDLQLGIPGEDVAGVIRSLDLLKAVKRGERPAPGATVMVVGGGNAAVDAARTAWRLGASRVVMLYRRTRAEMPAIKAEIEAAIEEGIEIQFLTNPKECVVENGRLVGVRCIRLQLGEVDRSGRRRPVEIPGSEFTVPADALIPAIGQRPDLSYLPTDHGFPTLQDGTLEVHWETLTTNKPGVFAAGDVVPGPRTIADAMAQGKAAAISIDRYLRGESLAREHSVTQPSPYIPPIELSDEEVERLARPPMPRLSVSERERSFAAVELGFDADMARDESRRCFRCDLASHWAAEQAAS